MIRANIYSVGNLPEHQLHAVREGIDLVSSYIGQAITSRVFGVRLATLENGSVDPARVGYGKLDKLTELHVFAVPLDPGVGERVGLAHLGEGVSYVDTSSGVDELVKTTTAHEVSHALGFVTPNMPNADPDSLNHCLDCDCIMHKKVMLEASVPALNLGWLKELTTVKRGLLRTIPHKQGLKVKSQHDFCKPCQVDMQRHADGNISKLRYDRVFGRSLLKKR